MTSKQYYFNTGTYKQGDDMEACIERNEGDLHTAFMDMARMYSQASERCVKMAQNLQGQNISVEASNHMIFVSGDSDILEPLFADDTLEESSEEDFDEDSDLDDDDFYDDDYSDEEDEYYDEEEAPFGDDVGFSSRDTLVPGTADFCGDEDCE